jgi:peptidyl-prolyl cis-trans isomerase SurA
MKRTFFIIVACLLGTVCALAQNKDEVLLTVGNEAVSRYEFEQIYLKNSQMMADTDKKSIEEYLDLFIVYKLKVADAKANGLHNTNEFKQELATYRKQLVQPHLVDKQTQEKLLKEAHERLKLEVNASHILISIPEDATAEDTLNLFNKTIKIRERILAGEPFESVARATSDDPSVKVNNGNLGYFTAFQMVYPFESAAYSTPVGEISMPIRSRFGYHIVKVNDKRPSPGQVKVAHIMIASPPDATEEHKAQAKHLADSVYSLVLANEDFTRLAKQFSQDPGTAQNGGELPWFGMRQMPPQFEKAAFSMRTPGEVSKPIQTQFGWHIIRLVDKRGVGTFEEMAPELKSRLARDERGRVSQNVFIDQLKNKFGFEVDSNALQTMQLLLDSSYYDGMWEMPSMYKNQFVFSFANKKHTLSELAQVIKQNRNRYINMPFSVIVDRCFNELVTEKVLAQEEERLINENREIKYLLKEYYDGILLFEVMDQNVWSRSTRDEEGLKEFYNNNILDYSWEQRVYVQRYSSANKRTIRRAKRYTTSRRGANATEEKLVNRYISKGDTLLQIQQLILAPDDILIQGFAAWEDNVSETKLVDGRYSFIKYQRTVKNDPIPLDEIRGRVIADYQEFLEKEWVESLRKKYPVNINQEVYQKIISNLN